MSRWIEKKENPVLPVYFVGIVWLICGLILPIYKLWALILTALLSAAGYGLGKILCPKRLKRVEQDFMTGSEDADEMLRTIDELLKKLKELNDAIPDDELSAAITRMEKAGAGILSEVESHPEKARQIRRFTNYYLPDAVKILTAYAELEKRGVSGENADTVRRQVADNAASIAKAFENQLYSLFEGEALDISTDLEVLQNFLKGQGLN